MKRAGVILVLPLLIALLTGDAMSQHGARPPHRRVQGANDVVQGVVVVKVRHGYAMPEGPLVRGPNGLTNTFAELGVTSINRAFPMVRPLNDADIAAGKVDLSQIHYATIPPDRDPGEVASELAALPQVEYAEPKYIYTICDVPNDSSYAGNQQLYFDRMNAPAGWAIAKGSPAVVIATVDGGTYWQHPDLEPNLWINGPEDRNHDGVFEPALAPNSDINGADDDGNGYVDDVIGWNFGTKSDNPRGFGRALADHGTGTASTFGAVTNNGSGMAGSSWGCRIMPICASFQSSTNTIDFGFDGIQYAYWNGAKVINCSWESGHPYSQYEQDIINAATQAGALVVAAAGNEGRYTDSLPVYPAAYDNVLSVGATFDTSDQKVVLPSWSSNYGANITVFAPGTDIWSATDDGSYKLAHGTSFSSPLVAGLAGILKSVHPTWTPNQIAKQIHMTADQIDGSNPGFAGLLGGGRVNFGRALSESPAGVDIVGHSLHALSGRSFAVSGDTVRCGITVRNILGSTARNLTFDLSSSDPAIVVTYGHVTIAQLDSGAQLTLGDFTFVVGPLQAQKQGLLRLDWVSNVDQHDARVYTVNLYANTGLWDKQSSPTVIALNSVKAVDATVAWAGGGWYGERVVVRTTDAGKTWNDASGNLLSSGVWCITATDANRAWIGSLSGEIFATTDGGVSWAQQNYPSPKTNTIDGLWFFDSENGFALGDPGPQSNSHFVVLQTTDGGSTWTHMQNEPAGGSFSYAWVNTFFWSDRNHGWFGTNTAEVIRTTDGGLSWLAGLTNAQDNIALSFKNDSVGLVANSSNGIDRTSDGGATWHSAVGWKSNPTFGLSYAPGSDLVWSLGSSAVYRSADDGATWVVQPHDSLLGTPKHVSFADAGNGWFVTSRGEIFHYLAALSAVAPLHVAIPPTAYTLEQNYPNPFNPTTVIRYSVPPLAGRDLASSEAGGGQLSVVSSVKLVVYDLLGQVVATLVNNAQAPGVYDVKFDGSRFSSGVYFCRMTAGPVGSDGRIARTFVETKKMVLMK